MSISKKKIREIEQLSFVGEILKAHDYDFVDDPPDSWHNKEERILFDMMAETEEKVKAAILDILNKKKL